MPQAVTCKLEIILDLKWLKVIAYEWSLIHCRVSRLLQILYWRFSSRYWTWSEANGGFSPVLFVCLAWKQWQWSDKKLCEVSYPTPLRSASVSVHSGRNTCPSIYLVALISQEMVANAIDDSCCNSCKEACGILLLKYLKHLKFIFREWSKYIWT